VAGRIRTIKPELREHQPFASLTDGAARLFLALYTIADDEGRCPAGAAFLGGAVFFARPRAAHVVGQLIGELERASLIATYLADGSPYLNICGWHEKGSVTHQRIEKPQPARYPAPTLNDSRTHSGNGSRSRSLTDLRPPTSDSDSDQDHRPQTEIAGAKRARKPASEPPAHALELAQLLHELISKNLPESKIAKHSEAAKKKAYGTWASDIDLLHREDGIAIDHIARAIRWCQAEPFWKSHILSGRKLREKYDTLEAQRTRAPSANGVGRATPATSEQHALDAAKGPSWMAAH
jgi:hypothetical protein